MELTPDLCGPKRNGGDGDGGWGGGPLKHENAEETGGPGAAHIFLVGQEAWASGLDAAEGGFPSVAGSSPPVSIL